MITPAPAASQKRPKILIFKLGLLGDVLMTTPFVRNLRRNYPDAEIQYWVGKSYRAALLDNPHLSKLVTFNERMFYTQDVRAVWQLWCRLRQERFDLAFFLGKHWIFNAFAASLRIPRRIGFARERISRFFLTDSVRYSALQHEIQYYLDLVSFVGRPDRSDVAMELLIPAADQERVDDLVRDQDLQGFVAAINSGGNNAGENKFVRRLPGKFFEELVAALAKTHPVVLLGNAADREHYEQLSLPKNVRNFAGTLSFRESVALMKRAQRIYATDCGGLHMAGAVNEHITAFFGPAHPGRKAPLVPDVEIVWPDREIYHARRDLYNAFDDIESFREISYSLGGKLIEAVC